MTISPRLSVLFSGTVAVLLVVATAVVLDLLDLVT